MQYVRWQGCPWHLVDTGEEKTRCGVEVPTDDGVLREDAIAPIFGCKDCQKAAAPKDVA